ncbi:MAG: hypothetical protein ABIP51_04940 [Bacteroidia bacterium]
MKKNLFYILFLFLFYSCDNSGSNNEIILLNNDTLKSNSLEEYYSSHKIIYKQYEGFTLFTSSYILGNPIIIPENASKKINFEVLSTNEIGEILKRPIEKIIYKTHLDSLTSIRKIINLVSENYKSCNVISEGNEHAFYLKEKLLCKISSFKDSTFVIVAIYPR